MIGLLFTILSMFTAVLLFAAEGRGAEVTVTASRMDGVRGCEMEFEVYKPMRPTTESVVILAHGFQRDLSTMRGWAEDWSSLGVSVVIPSLCNSSWLKGRHEKNAEDLVALRKQLDIRSVLYTGFSAGGLAAYLAALDDPSTLAYLGLDSVDSNDLASNAPLALTVPAFFLVGDSSLCNARQNFLKVIEKWDSYQHKQVEGASHCHFERPYDKRCGWVCGSSEDLSLRESQNRVSRLATAWLMEAMGVNQRKATRQ